MCVTRVGKILSIAGSRATVEFLDDRVARDIDVSMIEGIKKNSYVEVFADSALTQLTPKEARWRKKLWLEMRSKMSLE
jgi:hydrogenase maturation factor